MKKLMTIVLLALSTTIFAQELSNADKAMIKDAGIPIYSNSQFANGNNQVGFRFITNAKPSVVQNYYLEQLVNWELHSEYGGWILYNGEPGASIADLVMKKNQVSIQYNENLPKWFTVDKDMTTEIIIGVFD